MLKKVLVGLLAVSLSLSLFSCKKKEDKFPAKQVTIIMPWSVGGGYHCQKSCFLWGKVSRSSGDCRKPYRRFRNCSYE